MPDSAKLPEPTAQSVPFVHLRVHSAFSLSEGALKIKKLIDLAQTLKMPAVAVTDTNNLFGALEFSETMAAHGIQPIIGCTLMVDFATEGEDAPGANTSNGLYKVALIAKNQSGYAGLMKLTSKAFLETPETQEPHVSLQTLLNFQDGLICLTGGPEGVINRALVDSKPGLAKSRLQMLKQHFGDRLYIELQRHNTPAEVAAEPGLIELAYELEIPLVASNEPFFAVASDYAAHDALLCISQGAVVIEEDRRRLTPEHYFKTPREMAALFADIPEAIENTIEIARRCGYRPERIDPILPKFATENGQSEADLLRQKAEAGLKERLAKHGVYQGFEEKDYWDRLEYELKILIDMNFPGYFLIVADFIQWSKSGQGVWCRFSHCLGVDDY